MPQFYGSSTYIHHIHYFSACTQPSQVSFRSNEMNLIPSTTSTLAIDPQSLVQAFTLFSTFKEYPSRGETRKKGTACYTPSLLHNNCFLLFFLLFYYQALHFYSAWWYTDKKRYTITNNIKEVSFSSS